MSLEEKRRPELPEDVELQIIPATPEVGIKKDEEAVIVNEILNNLDEDDEGLPNPNQTPTLH